MNSLGRNREACARALLGYHRGVQRVRRRVRDGGRLDEQARAELDRLLFELEVDVGAREAESGRARMTGIEAELLHPTLANLRCSIAALPTRESPSRWEPSLAAAQALLRQAVTRLRTGEATARGSAHTTRPEQSR